MINKIENISRDDILFAFHLECPRPTIKDISKWIDRYPQFAEDIRIHASIARDLADEKENPLGEEQKENGDG